MTNQWKEDELAEKVLYCIYGDDANDPDWTDKKQVKYKLSLLLRDSFHQELSRVREETLKACGGCDNCFGKGYSTTHNHINHCSCDRGKQLKKLFERVRKETIKEVLKIKPEKIPWGMCDDGEEGWQIDGYDGGTIGTGYNQALQVWTNKINSLPNLK